MTDLSFKINLRNKTKLVFEIKRKTKTKVKLNCQTNS